jgi:hypothetical protein
MRTILLAVCFLSASHAAVDIGVDSITNPECRGHWIPAHVTPSAIVSNSGSDTATFSAWFLMQDDGRTVRYFESTSVARLAPGAETVVVFRPDTLWGPAGDWLARCSTYSGADTNPSNDTLSLPFLLYHG